MEGVERVLTVINYGADEEGPPGTNKTRITISPGMVLFIIASDEPEYVIDNIDLYRVNVILTESNNLELFISRLDLDLIQRAVGGYFTQD